MGIQRTFKAEYGELYVSKRLPQGDHMCNDMVRVRCTKCGTTQDVSYAGLKLGHMFCGRCWVNSVRGQ